MRGRPPVSRAKVLTYYRKHWPCPVMQIVRATGVERSRCRRILKQLYDMGEIAEFSPIGMELEIA